MVPFEKSPLQSFEESPLGSSSAVGFSTPPVISSSSSFGSGITGFISNLLNMFQTYRTSKINREWTENQNNLAWQRQRQLIDEQRSYDSPKAQMQRLMEAGLNPNLIYGSLSDGHSAVSAPNAAGTYQGVAPQFDPYALALDAQVRNTNADTELKLKSAEKSVQEVKNLQSVYDLNREQARWIVSNRELVKSQADWYVQDTINKSYDQRVKEYDVQVKQDTWKDIVDMVHNDLKASNEQAKYLSEYVLASLHGLQSEADKNWSLAKAANAEAGLSVQELEVQKRAFDDILKMIKFGASEQVNLAASAYYNAEMAKFIKEHQNADRNWNIFSKIMSFGQSAGIAAGGVGTFFRSLPSKAAKIGFKF